MNGPQRAVFLDRDGVINRSLVVGRKPFAPRRLEDFRLLPGTARAVRDLKEAGFLVIVVTNQPDIGNGLVEAAMVEAMNARIRRAMPVDEILVCPHSQTAGCACRKPRPGMLVEAARRHSIDLTSSYMVGDRGGDIVAGHTAGCYTFLVERLREERGDHPPNCRVRSLPQATKIILDRLTKGL